MSNEYTLTICPKYCEIRDQKPCPFLRAGERHDHVDGETYKEKYEFCARYGKSIPIKELREGKCTMFEIVIRDK